MRRVSIRFGWALSCLFTFAALARQGPTLGEPDSDEQRRAVIAEVRSASAEERRLLVDIATDCKWPVDPEIYLIHGVDSVTAECQRETRRYTIEFLQNQEFSGKREIDRQLSQAGFLELNLLTNISIMESVYRRKALIAKAPEIVTSSERHQVWLDYASAEQGVSNAVRTLNHFYNALGACLREAREDK